MASKKDKERVGELRRARGVLFEERNGQIKLLKSSYTKDELQLLVRTLGKRAQSRIKALAKDFDEKGRRYRGRYNALYERYKDWKIGTFGLTTQALRVKVNQAVEILNSKFSTITGYNAIHDKAYNTFIENHPKLKWLTRDQWEKYVLYMSSFQQANKDAQYDSEQLLEYTNWASLTSEGGEPEIEATPETLTEWFLDIEREGSSGTWFKLTEDFDDLD